MVRSVWKWPADHHQGLSFLRFLGAKGYLTKVTTAGVSVLVFVGGGVFLQFRCSYCQRQIMLAERPKGRWPFRFRLIRGMNRYAFRFFEFTLLGRATLRGL
jgi:hypothetical protein